MIELGKLAQIRRGYTTGAIDFLCLTKEKAKHWKIEDEYLKPAISEPSKLRNLDIQPSDLTHQLLLVHERKANLQKKKTNVLRYILHGEKTRITVKKGAGKNQKIVGYNNLRTTRSRRVWYDLRKREPAPICICRFIRGRTMILWNEANAFATDNFHEVYPKNKTHTQSILGFLTSSVGELMLAMSGRHQGLGLLQLMVYEVKNVQILNPNVLRFCIRKRIEKAFAKLCVARRKNQTENEQRVKKDLDNAVFDALELNRDERKQVYDGLRAIKDLRQRREEVQVLLKSTET
jgi:hypothetical protein